MTKLDYMNNEVEPVNPEIERLTRQMTSLAASYAKLKRELAELSESISEQSSGPATPDDADIEHDAVNSPAHYTQGGVEVIDIIAQTVAGYDDPFVGHCVATTTKYLNRAPYKHESPLEDLRKAREYLTFAIDHIEAKESAQ